jgi:hypothetical protein
MTRWDIDKESYSGVRRHTGVVPYLPAVLLAVWAVVRLLI